MQVAGLTIDPIIAKKSKDFRFFNAGVDDLLPTTYLSLTTDDRKKDFSSNVSARHRTLHPICSTTASSTAV
jgi:hypothetical protein